MWAAETRSFTRVTSLRRAFFTSVPPVLATDRRRCEWAPLSIRPFLIGPIRAPHEVTPAEARVWYERARDLGEVEAERWLKSLGTKQGKQLP